MAHLGDSGSIKKVDELYDNEIIIMDYFFVLWKHKFLIFFGSLIPLLVTGTVLYLSPRQFTVTYIFDVKDHVLHAKDFTSANQKDHVLQTKDFTSSNIYSPKDELLDQRLNVTKSLGVSNWNLDAKNYILLVNRFYSENNINRVASRLKAAGLDDYAKQITNPERAKDLVQFKAWPLNFDLDFSSLKGTDVAKLEQAGQLKAQLLNVTIASNSKENIYKISSIIIDNLKTIIPLYMVAEQQDIVSRQIRAEMGAIEEEKYTLQLALKESIGILSKLKTIITETSIKTKSEIMLQFDLGGKSEYLPIEYQVQIAQSKIIHLEETISNNEERYHYYSDLLDLNENLCTELNNKVMSDYTIQQFHSLLIELAKGAEKQEMKDYLNFYAKGIENRIAAGSPIIENPAIKAVSKGTTKISGIAFIAALILSASGAFLLEGYKNHK